MAPAAGCDKAVPEAETTTGPLLQVFATTPASNAKNVPVNAPIVLKFDRFLLPETAVRQSLLVTGGSFVADSGAPLPGTTLSFQPTYDPLARTVTYRPLGNYQPGTLYTVVVRKPSEDDNSLGFRAWDGAELASTVTFQFETSLDPSVLVPAEVDTTCTQCMPINRAGTDGPISGAPGRVDDRGLSTLTGSDCAFSGCHAPGTRDAPPHGAMGLDLSDYAAIQKSALLQVAHQTLTGPASTAERRALSFGRTMPLIDPGNPGNSYLLYKLMLGPGLFDDASGDDAAVKEALPQDDLRRLAATFVVGAPMPYGGSLTFAQAKAVSRWIASGAGTCESKQPTVNCACTVPAPKVEPIVSGSGGAGGAGTTCTPDKEKSFGPFWDPATGKCVDVVKGCGLKCTGEGCGFPWASCAEATQACGAK